jgi:hypothetical protein
MAETKIDSCEIVNDCAYNVGGKCTEKAVKIVWGLTGDSRGFAVCANARPKAGPVHLNGFKDEERPLGAN